MKSVSQVWQNPHYCPARCNSVPAALKKKRDFFEFDTVIVAIVNYLQEKYHHDINVKEAGVPRGCKKASSQSPRQAIAAVKADTTSFILKTRLCWHDRLPNQQFFKISLTSRPG